ncbi:hypothetical protein T4C_7872, partial [Trichinella pseudospiralis]
LKRRWKQRRESLGCLMNLLLTSLCTKRTLDLKNSIFCRRDAVD